MHRLQAEGRKADSPFSLHKLLLLLDLHVSITIVWKKTAVIGLLWTVVSPFTRTIEHLLLRIWRCHFYFKLKQQHYGQIWRHGCFVERLKIGRLLIIILQKLYPEISLLGSSQDFFRQWLMPEAMSKRQLLGVSTILWLSGSTTLLKLQCVQSLQPLLSRCQTTRQDFLRSIQR